MQDLFLTSSGVCYITNSEVFFSSMNLLHFTLENNPGKTACILKFNLFSYSLSSLQKKSQQEDSEEEEENAPQWHGSSETWRIAASVNNPLHNVLRMKWLCSLCPVSGLFFLFFLIQPVPVISTVPR